MLIYITQCKCPTDHCVIAFAWEARADELAGLRPYMEQRLERDAKKMFDRKVLNPYCGLCGSREFTYSTIATPWKTIEEATPHLLKSEKQQLRIAGISPGQAEVIRACLQEASNDPGP